jgi:hypothetical protein
VWASGAWKYARCPRCYRQDLTTWSQHYYRPPLWTVLLLRMGATPYRCAPCRCNFASYRPCREKYLWRKNAADANAQINEAKSPDGEVRAPVNE